MKPTFLPSGILLIATLIIWTPIHAQYSILTNRNARSIALASIQNGFHDISAIQGNQAGLAALEYPSAELTAIQHYSIVGLTQVAIALAYPIPRDRGTVFTRLFQFGDKEYYEQSFTLGYSRYVTDKLGISGQFHVLRIAIGDYGAVWMPGFQLGIQGQVSDNCWLGAKACNPLTVTDHEGIITPGQLSIGIRCNVNTSAALFGEIEKTFLHPPLLKFAIEYRAVPRIQLRIGASTSRYLASFGIGYRLSTRLFIDIAAAYHAYLGITPAISFAYSGKNE